MRAGALDDVALFNVGVFAEDGASHVILFQIEGDAVDFARELEKFHGHALFHPVDPGDAVTHGEDRAGLGHFHLLFVILDLRADNLADFLGSDFHLYDLAFS